ncbi:MAG: PEP-CTERM sorting domain-containing protein [Burkholderiales bacterium]|nr:PEP-CTERM sorting domain-containing protein [Burkholderiales bacterium]
MKKLLSIALLLIAAHTQAGPILEYTPSITTFNAADSFTVDVRITGLGSDIVAAYDLDFLYDSSILSATAVTFDPGSYLGDPNAFLSLQLSVLDIGLVDVLELSFLSDADLATLQAGLNGTVPLFSIAFTAQAAGDASALQGFRFDQFNDVKCARNVQCIPAIASVPEPSTPLLLAIAGIAGWSGRRFWRRT